MWRPVERTRHHGPVETFPRQKALTRSFRLGVPRNFHVTPDQVLFIRSQDGRSPAGDLWIMRAADEWRETALVTSTQLCNNSVELDPAEAARRERLREVTTGITDYSVDEGAHRAAFAVNGDLYWVTTASAEVHHVVTEHPVIDPRISPDGAHIAFVMRGAVWIVTLAAGTDATVGGGSISMLVEPEADTVAYGLADFVAAEELERHRGLWWLADSSALLIERFDEAHVPVRWISDPADPEHPAREHRYPQAGHDNPEVSLHLARIDGTSLTPIDWDHDRYPYLATVSISKCAETHAPAAVISVLDRSQSEQCVFDIHPDGTTSPVAVREQQPWVSVVPGVPRRDAGGNLLEVLVHEDTFTMFRDGTPLTPAGMNVDSVITADAEGYVFGVQTDPMHRSVMRLTTNGSQPHPITPEHGWCSAAVADGSAKTRVTVCTDWQSTRSHAVLITPSHETPITTCAEVPLVTPSPLVHIEGMDELRCVVLLPRDHVPGTSLPVICSPYGGPHAQRVIAAGGAYLTEQWLADQGFAVVVIDGRGTPGRGPAWEFSVHHDLASGVLADQVAGLRSCAAAYPDLDLGRVGIRGWSFGGYLAALAVLDRPDVFHAAVAGAPVTEWRLYDTAYTERYLGHPDANSDIYDANSLLTRARQLTRPLLLIHGLADDNVLAAHTLHMSRALLEAGRSHNVLPLSGVTHMTPQEVVAENLLLTEVEFFREHLTS